MALIFSIHARKSNALGVARAGSGVFPLGWATMQNVSFMLSIMNATHALHTTFGSKYRRHLAADFSRQRRNADAGQLNCARDYSSVSNGARESWTIVRNAIQGRALSG